MNIFEEIKKVTSGYLAPEVYEKLYHYAKSAKTGNILEIGPAQGASTICFAMAMKENDNIKKIYSIDRFCNSAALKFQDHIEKNIETIRENLRHFHLDPLIEFVPFREHDYLQCENISLLFIDADGAIDRDFSRYFNHVADKGIIIIDDYEKMLNLQARTRFLRMQGMENVACFLKNNNIENVEEYSFLGKQYLTYSIVNDLVEHRFIEILENDNGTIFCRKREDAPIYGTERQKEICRLRETHSSMYLEYREKVSAEYNKLDGALSEVMAAFKMEHAMIYSCYYYEIKNRDMAAKVHELHVDSNSYIKDDYRIQDIDLEALHNVDAAKDICEGRSGGNVISDFLHQEGYDRVVYVMLKEGDKLEGIAVLFDCGGEKAGYGGADVSEPVQKLQKEFHEAEKNVEMLLLQLKEKM